MTRAATFALVFLIACGSETPRRAGPDKHPISVRGWIEDVEGAPNAPFRTTETEAARKTQLFQATSVWIEGAPYVSGGVMENGSFVLLDVPPGDVTITFHAPGADRSTLRLQAIPGTADVLVPHLLLRQGEVKLLEPDTVRVRLAKQIDRPRPTNQKVRVAGSEISVTEVPIKEMADRRDFPNPTGATAPVAIVK